MSRKRSVREKLAGLWDLPGDAVAGLPRVELVGDGELRVENHRGLLSYGKEEIHIGGGPLIVRVVGEDLTVKAMNAEELLITGQIRAVELN